MSEMIKPSMRTDVMSIPQGRVALSFPESITQDDYDDIVAWFGLVQKKLQRMIVSQSPASGILARKGRDNEVGSVSDE